MSTFVPCCISLGWGSIIILMMLRECSLFIGRGGLQMGGGGATKFTSLFKGGSERFYSGSGEEGGGGGKKV